MGVQISTRSLQKKPAEQVFRFVRQAKAGAKRARSARPPSLVSRAPRPLRASFPRKNTPVMQSVTKETLVAFDH